MKTKLLAAVGMALASLAMVGVTSRAQADQITLANSAPNSLTLIGNGLSPPSATITSSGASGNAFFDAFGGTYSFSAMNFSVGPENTGGLFPFISQTVGTTFTYTDGTNSLTASVVWEGVTDDSPTPTFDGILHISSISGSSAFVADFGPVGQPDPFDFTIARLSANFDQLMAAGATVGANISSGEAVPGPTAGTGLPGLILAGGFLFAWRRNRRTNRDVSALLAA